MCLFCRSRSLRINCVPFWKNWWDPPGHRTTRPTRPDDHSGAQRSNWEKTKNEQRSPAMEQLVHRIVANGLAGLGGTGRHRAPLPASCRRRCIGPIRDDPHDNRKSGGPRGSSNRCRNWRGQRPQRPPNREESRRCLQKTGSRKPPATDPIKVGMPEYGARHALCSSSHLTIARV